EQRHECDGSALGDCCCRHRGSGPRLRYSATLPRSTGEGGAGAFPRCLSSRPIRRSVRSVGQLACDVTAHPVARKPTPATSFAGPAWGALLLVRELVGSARSSSAAEFTPQPHLSSTSESCL